MQRIHGEDVCCFLDQSIDRMPIAKPHEVSGPIVCPTLCASSKMWLASKSTKGKRGRQRLLTGREALSLQGFPHNRVQGIDQFPDGLLSDLAGNAYPLLVIMAILMSVLVTVPWKTPETDNPTAPSDTDSDHNEAESDAAHFAMQALRRSNPAMESPNKRAKKAHD